MIFVLLTLLGTTLTLALYYVAYRVVKRGVKIGVDKAGAMLQTPQTNHNPLDLATPAPLTPQPKQFFNFSVHGLMMYSLKATALCAFFTVVVIIWLSQDHATFGGQEAFFLMATVPGFIIFGIISLITFCIDQVHSKVKL